MNTTYFADQSSGLGAFGVNFQALIIQMLTFLIVYLVLRKYAFKPILKVLKERRDTIEAGLKLGAEMQKKNDELNAKTEELLHKAQKDADKLISDSRDEAKAIVSESEEAAKAKAEGILNDANRTIEQNTLKAKKKLEKELVGLISEATEALVGEKIDSEKDSKIIDGILKGKEA